MNLSLETKEWLENKPKELHDLPLSHTEGMDTEKLRDMTLNEAMLEVGKRLFSEEIKNNPGTLDSYLELVKDGNPKKFAESYVDYCTDPGKLRNHDPLMYNFMRDRIFYGREYPDVPSSQRISFT